MTETSGYFYLKLKSGGHIIIPKSATPDLTESKTELKKLCQKLNIGFIEDLNWKWK